MTTESEAQAAMAAAHSIRDQAEAVSHATISAGPSDADPDLPYDVQEREPDSLDTAYALENGIAPVLPDGY